MSSKESDNTKTQKKTSAGSGWSRILRPEMLVAVSAIIISLSALVVSLYETSLIRQEQHASVWPHLTAGPSISEGHVRFLVINNGIGPAIVRDVMVTVDDKPMTNWSELLENVTEGSGPFSYAYSLINGFVIPPGQDYPVVWMHADEGVDGELIQHIADDIERIDMSVCYCSVYNDCWMVSMGESIPREADANQCNFGEGNSFDL